MHRFFADKECFSDSVFTIKGDLHRQVTRVLRTRPGERFIVVNGDGFEYTIEMKSINATTATAVIVDKTEKNLEPAVDITMYAGTLKSKGIEELIPPLVYLGVHRLIPVATARSEGRFQIDTPEKQDRIKGITGRATALCGRTKLMEVRNEISYKESVRECSSNHWNFIFWENTEKISFRQVLRRLLYNENNLQGQNGHLSEQQMKIGLFIGPEGGFTGEEFNLAGNSGIIPASLGQRILDARTAPIAAVSALLYEIGDL
ncbi:MAG: RsmE family RNA methyltransferase [Firmicutes bacterium]|nr:RsmE family RNA methyltransferase [Bacillota bacterium]